MDLASSLRLLPEHQGLRLATSPPALLGTKRRCPPTSWQPPQESRASSPALCARASSPTSLATSLQQRPAAAVPAVLPEPSPQDQPSARTPQEYLKAIAPEVRLQCCVRGRAKEVQLGCLMSSKLLCGSDASCGSPAPVQWFSCCVSAIASVSPRPSRDDRCASSTVGHDVFA